MVGSLESEDSEFACFGCVVVKIWWVLDERGLFYDMTLMEGN